MLHSYLTEAPSICLPASFRWAIALETRHCLTGCKGCVELNAGTLCERDGAAYKLMKSANHTSCPHLPYEVTDRSSWERVRNMVHFTVNHQSRADAAWYESTIKSLGQTSLVSKKKFPVDSERRNVLVATLFSEILSTVLASHAIHTVYLAMGQDPPPLPNIDAKLDEKLPCTYQDVVTAGLLKKDKSMRYDKCCHVPHILYKDINTKSKAFQAYPEKVRAFLKENMMMWHPLIALTLAPQSMAFCGTLLEEKFGMPNQEMAMAWRPLNNSRFCTQDGFSRADWTVIQSVITEAYGTVA